MKEQHKGEEKKSEYIYTSTEICRFYGITVKGMEFYENKGLVHPQRIGKSKLRRFTLEDSYRLYLTRLFKNSGIGLQQTLSLLDRDTPERVEEKLNSQLCSLREEMKLQTMRYNILSHLADMFKRGLSDEPFFEIVERPGFYRLFLRQFNGPHESNSEESEEYCHWNEYLPITAASLRFPLADCQENAGSIDTQIGLIIEKEAFDQLGFAQSNRTQFIPGGRFLHTVIRGNAQTLTDTAWLQPALRYMRENALTQTGDAFSRFIILVQDETVCIRYDEAWFPLQ